MNKTLYVFTATYPYGDAETFMEDEILYLCKAFTSIVIIPLSGNISPIRKVPLGCKVSRPILKNRLSRYILGLLGVRAFPVFMRDFFAKKVYLSKKRFKAWLIAYTQTNMLLRSSIVKRVFNNIGPDDICYFYWGKGSNVLSIFFKGKCHFISRFHGEWDLWEESSGGYAPLRKQLSKSLNLAVFISKNGESYFKSKYPECNTEVFPLGSLDYGECDDEKKDTILRVVSCSTVYPLKRVPLIFEALNSMDSYQIEWTHIGSGKDFDELKQKVATEKRRHLSVNLLGNMKHADVMTYYKSHRFDVFINMSTNEGVPVSIMEAESFNIPVVATNVGCTSEVVTEQTGVLISANPSLEEIKEAVIKVLNLTLSPREFWFSHYNAEANYKLFAEKLQNI